MHGSVHFKSYTVRKDSKRRATVGAICYKGHCYPFTNEFLIEHLKERPSVDTIIAMRNPTDYYAKDWSDVADTIDDFGGEENTPLIHINMTFPALKERLVELEYEEQTEFKEAKERMQKNEYLNMADYLDDASLVAEGESNVFDIQGMTKNFVFTNKAILRSCDWEFEKLMQICAASTKRSTENIDYCNISS